MVSPEEFELKSSQYFAECRNDLRRPTIAGLALALGFSSRQSMHDYKKDPDYAHAMGRAYLYIEDYVTDAMLDKDRATTGHIFYLKSVFGYEDKHVIDNLSSDGSMSPAKTLDDFYSE